MHENEDLKPRTVKKCRCKNDWVKWKEALQVELDPLPKCEIFGSIVRTPRRCKFYKIQMGILRK